MRLIQKVFTGIALFCLLFSSTSCSTKTEKIYPFNDPSKSVDERVENLLDHLTLEEKAGFLSGETMWYLQEISRLEFLKCKLQTVDMVSL